MPETEPENCQAVDRRTDRTMVQSLALCASGGSRMSSVKRKSTIGAATSRQGNDAECGFACHTIVKNWDYGFTEYAHRPAAYTDARAKLLSSGDRY